MSHAVYCFLTTADEPMEEFDANVNYDTYAFDENNWYQGMCEVHKDGTVVSLCPPDDWRGRNSLTEKFNALSKEDRWNEAVSFAKSCLMNDIKDALIAGDWENAKKYEEGLTPENAEKHLRKRLVEDGSTLEGFYVACIADQVYVAQHLTKGELPNEFSSPYDSPRFVSVGDATLTDEDAKILFVDIHT